jgi:primosomal replication protein N
MHNLIDNNKLKLAGKILTTPEFYLESYGEKFYKADLEVPRLSDAADVLPILISEKILTGVDKGCYVSVAGQLRSYNKTEDDHRRLLLFAFSREIDVITEEEFHAIDSPNEITINGFICKTPVYRTTPFGREITDLLIAVNRPYKKSDYIPNIAWGRNARFCKDMSVGTHVEVTGRLQSREYTKKIGEVEIPRMAYEVSVTKIKPVEEAREDMAVTE